MLELFDLYPQRDRPIRELSCGERVALTLATAIAPRASLLVLDDLIQKLPEPLQHKVWDYLEACRSQQPFALLSATASSQNAERADRVAIMDSGRTLAVDRPAELLAQCGTDRITVEPVDPEAVQRTLRGVFDVEVSAGNDSIRFSAADGEAAVAQIMRHPAGTRGASVVFLKPPTLWDVLASLRSK
jgi:ABC-type multidrug transport system ATPase subunit